MFQTVILGFLSLPLLFIIVQLYLKFTRAHCKSKRRLNGLVAIVTGSNQGIGFETAKDLAHRGAKVILACRDLKRGQVAADEIRHETKNKNVVCKKLDLSSLTSVRTFCAEILKEEKRLDILVNNAGVALAKINKIDTEDGFETHFATNHLGPFLLTNLLLGLMIKTGKARIVNVSSNFHHHAKAVDLDDLNYDKNFNPKGIYSTTKLYNVMFTTEMHKRIAAAGLENKVTVNALHPGIVRTEIFRDVRKVRLYGLFIGLIQSLMMNVIEGAQTSIFLSVSEEVEGISGLYWVQCKIAKMNKLAQDAELTKNFWEASKKFVKLQPHEYHLKI